MKWEDRSHEFETHLCNIRGHCLKKVKGRKERRDRGRKGQRERRKEGRNEGRKGGREGGRKEKKGGGKKVIEQNCFYAMVKKERCQLLCFQGLKCHRRRMHPPFQNYSFISRSS
jgi:hypothetical protein